MASIGGGLPRTLRVIVASIGGGLTTFLQEKEGPSRRRPHFARRTAPRDIICATAPKMTDTNESSVSSGVVPALGA